MMFKSCFINWVLGCGMLSVATAGSQQFRPQAREVPHDAPAPARTPQYSPKLVVSTPYATSYQVNVSATGQNIVGDAANEPSLCLDPANPNRIAIGWRQFDSTNSDFRQAGWAFSTNGGGTWTFGGVLETNVFRSDPVLAADAGGPFYYLSLNPTTAFNCDLWNSTNGGANWQRQGDALGGDKAWLTIDRSASPGRGNIYQCWSIYSNTYSNRTFSLSRDGGLSWTNPFAIPEVPFWSTVDVGPEGELYLLGWNGTGFWFNRSTNASNAAESFNFDLSTGVDLGGGLATGGINPVGLLGQPWVAVDRSTNQTRGNIYGLCTTVTNNNLAEVMFARSLDGGVSWSAPMRINDDAAHTNAWHWFGTLSVAPNGRIDACWYDTRNYPGTNLSELYYSYSWDAGQSWAPNRPISPAFNPGLGYPLQQKMGDYIGMISLEDAACIAYTATFNGEEDVYFVRVDQPISTTITNLGDKVVLSWSAVPAKTYCVQAKTDWAVPWTAGANVGCITATNTMATLEDDSINVNAQRFYRVVKQP